MKKKFFKKNLAVVIVIIAIGVNFTSGTAPALSITLENSETVQPLGGSGIITGKVSNGLDGTPIVGATVIARGMAPLFFVHTATTDGNGDYTLNVVLCGWPYYVHAEKDGYYRSDTKLVIVNSSPEICNFRLYPFNCGRIYGKIHNIFGKGIADATVRVYRFNPLGEEWEFVSKTNTDSLGLYEFTGFGTGEYKVTVEKQGYTFNARPGIRMGLSSWVYEVNLLIIKKLLSSTTARQINNPLLFVLLGRFSSFLEGRL